MKFDELDGVRTLRSFPEHNIEKGQKGVIIEVYHEPDGGYEYEVEFLDNDGYTIDYFTIKAEDLERTWCYKTKKDCTGE